MFRAMRLANEALTPEQINTVLRRRTAGVLAVHGDAGYPYAVPLSYYFDGTHFYFHGAPVGHKMAAIQRDNRVSFCVVDRDVVAPAALTNEFRSVIAFGRVTIVTDPKRKRELMRQFALHLAPDYAQKIHQHLDQGLDHFSLLEMTVAHMTGKEAADLAQSH